MATMVSVREIDAAHLVIGDLKDALEVIHYCLINDTEADDGQDGREYAAMIAKQAINLINGYKFGLVRTNERALLDG